MPNDGIIGMRKAHGQKCVDRGYLLKRRRRPRPEAAAIYFPGEVQ
jgi:hypothetical protein